MCPDLHSEDSKGDTLLSKAPVRFPRHLYAFQGTCMQYTSKEVALFCGIHPTISQPQQLGCTTCGAENYHHLFWFELQAILKAYGFYFIIIIIMNALFFTLNGFTVLLDIYKTLAWMPNLFACATLYILCRDTLLLLSVFLLCYRHFSVP